ncbi:Small RNA 2'-O-methyltransferase [Mortierella polycephala]|uniref:Small RNA 2'-O-methyltransferase n=1 Tax=Mortierella polycephala TaxID=41804 RepID=A0A9P6PVR9_9FUNG|nr:Small RNA 2'-O-methyltransferase [Mortierella polycephala]
MEPLPTTPSLPDEQAEEATFFPPLWQQRRNLARRILEENHATSVIDFGCGEAALTSLLAWESAGDYPMTRLLGVDLDEERLELAKGSCEPQDFELGSNLRVNELTIELYCGSVSEADSRLRGYDALACLEVVEHLDPEVLEKFWGVVLGALKPKLVIVSTPNAEFNIYFPQLNYGTKDAIFRNDDHRFEWTRQEFQTWCNAAATEYGYDVSFTGAGMLSNSDPAVGPCTQFAILKDLHPSQDPRVPTSKCYSLISKIEYPVYSEVHSDEEILAFLHEKIARIRPLPPQSSSDDKSNDLYWHTEREQMITAEEKEEVSESTTMAVPEPEVELGVLPVDDLWSSLEVRQRCKTQAKLIRFLETSSLVQLEQDHDNKQQRIRLNEEGTFWKEFDESEARARAEYNRERFMGYNLSSDDHDYDSDDNYEHEYVQEGNDSSSYHGAWPDVENGTWEMPNEGWPASEKHDWDVNEAEQYSDADSGWRSPVV